MSSLNELAESYFAARRVYDEKARIAKEAAVGVDEAELRLIDAMLDQHAKGIDFGELKVLLKSSWSIKCNKGNEAQVRDFLQTKYGDVTQYEQRKLNKAAIAKFLKEEITTGKLPDLPEFFGLRTRPILNVLGWQGEKRYQGNDEDE